MFTAFQIKRITSRERSFPPFFPPPPVGIIIPDNLPITLQESFQKEKNTTLCSCDHKSNWAENKSVKKKKRTNKKKRYRKDRLMFHSVKNNIIQWANNKEMCYQLLLEILIDTPPTPPPPNFQRKSLQQMLFAYNWWRHSELFYCDTQLFLSF